VNNYATIYNTVGQGKFPDGTLAAPSVRFSDDLDTGFYRSAANEVTFVAGGVAQFKYNTSGLVMSSSAAGIANLTTTGNTTLGDALADTVTINGTPTINAPTAIVANSATNALRITQTGAGNALLVEDAANPDATPFVIDADGLFVSGHTSSVPAYGFGNQLQVLSSSNAYQLNAAFRNDAFAPLLTIGHSRNATVGSHTVVQSGDELGAVAFAGSDGTQFIRGAQITAAVDGTPGLNDMPGRLVFSTTRDGASSPTEGFRLDNQQRFSMGGAAGAGQSVVLNRNTTGSATSYGVLSQPQIQSDVVSNAYTFYAGTNTAAAAFTLSNAIGFAANQAAIGATSAITNQIGFDAGASLTGGANNYGFRSNIASGTGRWNFYAAGSADNYFAGSVGIGGSPGAGFQLDIQGSGTRSLRAWSTDTTGATVGNIEAAFGSGGGTSILRMRAGSGYTSISSTGASDPLIISVGGTERLRLKSTGQLRYVPLAAAPAGAENGDLYYNSTTHKFQGYANGAWVDLH